MRVLTIILLAVVGAVPCEGQDIPRGRVVYDQLCARCHGGDATGGQSGPGIVTRLALRADADLALLIREGIPQRGMPPSALSDADAASLVAHLRTLRPREGVLPALQVRLVDGTTVSGVVMNRSHDDLQLLDDSGRLRLLRRDGEDGEPYRAVTSGQEWPTYHGTLAGNRFSALDQVTAANVHRLAPRWIFSMSGAERLQTTPVVVGGVMYVTNVNEVVALDAGSGRRIWRFQMPRTRGLAGDAAAGINRGVAVAGDRVFMTTDHAHLVALDRHTGERLWDVEMADWRQNYGATSAPLAVGRLVVSGISGGDEGVRGFLSAFDQETGREVWRFWTVPKPGEPGSDTWRGRDIEHGCASTWLTGTYDAELDTLYWPTGNPCPDYDGRERQGDNLYSDSLLALDPRTGRLKWHFQYTPHDLWDWDAQQPPLLVDAMWEGRARKLILHANRNGFFYVLDRADGTLLRATPFVKKLTWASRIGPDGRPVLNPHQTPTPEGVTVCPAVEGATNWFSTAFDAVRGLYYVQALEKCTVYSLVPGQWEAGKSFYSGTTRNVPGERGEKILRAIDIATGATRWELPQSGPGNSWGGVLATTSGLVFFGDDSGAFAAVDSSTGQRLWQFQTNALWKASPMTFTFDGRQYIAVAAGPSVIAFALTP
jgi:alcohol dehydrogenase (cytochrome c)